MNTSEIDERINELEFKVAYQDDLIEDLNQVIASQQKELLLLNEKLSLLAKQLESYRTQQAIQEGERPPHY